MHIEGAPTTLGGNAILFGDFRWVPTARTLTRGGRPVQVGARVHDILNALLERAGQVVSKAELLSIVWPNTFVDESALRVHMAALRRALGDGEAGTRLIVSVRGRGYTFVADTQQVSAPRDSSASRDRGHAPAPLVRVIGRDEVIQEAADHMKRTRFVTLTGTGGIGKTAVAHAIIEKFAEGVNEEVVLR